MTDTFVGVCKICKCETDLIEGVCLECRLKKEQKLKEINWEEVEKMTTEQIEDLRVEKIKYLGTMETNAGIVKEKITIISKEILQKEIAKKDLTITYGKARQNIKMLEHDIEILKSKFFRSRR